MLASLKSHEQPEDLEDYPERGSPCVDNAFQCVPWLYFSLTGFRHVPDDKKEPSLGREHNGYAWQSPVRHNSTLPNGVNAYILYLA